MILAKLTADVHVDDELIIAGGTTVEIEDMDISSTNRNMDVVGIRFRNKSYIIPKQYIQTDVQIEVTPWKG